MTDELVMVVPRQALFGRSPVFQGFSPNAEGYFGRCLEEHLFMPRRRAESDERYKQIIPYVVLQTCPGPDQRYQYMIFQRTRGGDPRLGRLYSIGLGGHVNSSDVLVPPVVRAPAARRGERSAEGAAGPSRGRQAPRAAAAALPAHSAQDHAAARRVVAASLPQRSQRGGRPAVTRWSGGQAGSPGGAPLRQQGRPAGTSPGETDRPTRRVIRRLKFAPDLRALVEPLAGPRSHEHPLFHGIRRELREEVAFPPGAQLSLLGVINDDQSAVGRVHFGIAFLLEVPPSVQVRRRRRRGGRLALVRGGRRSSIRLRKEAGTSQVGDLFPLDLVMTYRHAMESWSTLLLDAGVLRARPLPGQAAM